MSYDFSENAERKLSENWEIHRRIFAPILDSAFTENLQARVTLTAALNHISNRQTEQGRELLNSIKSQCIYDADKAAWSVFMGVSYDMNFENKKMLYWYKKSADYDHNFYLPYLKIAKAAHSSTKFYEAYEYYLKTADCLLQTYDVDYDILLGTKSENNKDVVLASVYCNTVSCLTMMHEYDKAEEFWHKAQKYTLQPGADAYAAILFAAKGNKDKMESYLDALRKNFLQWFLTTKEMTSQIVENKHPHFSMIPFDSKKINEFWAWFLENENILGKTADETPEKFIDIIAEKIRFTFDFLNKAPSITVIKKNNRFQLSFFDCYAVSLHYGYAELFKKCPKELFEKWSFLILH